MRIRVAGEDYKLDLPKKHLSFSQIDTFQRCPEQYRRRYVEGERTPDGHAPAEGRAFSRTLEASCCLKLGTGKHLSLTNLGLRHHEYSAEEMEQFPGRIEGARKRARDFFKALLAKEKEIPLHPTWIGTGKRKRLGVELKKTVKIAGVPVMCIPDLIEVQTIWDYKVTAAPEYYIVETSLQLALYAVAFNIWEVGYLLFNKRTGDYECSSKLLDSVKTKRWVSFVVSSVAEAISQRAFPVCNPERNNLCSKKNCGFWSTCHGTCC